MIVTSRRRWALLSLGAGIAAVAAVLALQVSTMEAMASETAATGWETRLGSPGKALTASVLSSTPVAPGRQATITVRVSNPNNQPVRLTDLSGRVTGVTSGTRPAIPTCDPAWFQIGTWQGSQLIAAKSTGTAAMPVSFDNKPTTNQDNCKGVRYTYSFTATGVQS